MYQYNFGEKPARLKQIRITFDVIPPKKRCKKKTHTKPGKQGHASQGLPGVHPGHDKTYRRAPGVCWQSCPFYAKQDDDYTHAHRVRTDQDFCREDRPRDTTKERHNTTAVTKNCHKSHRSSDRSSSDRSYSSSSRSARQGR